MELNRENIKLENSKLHQLSLNPNEDKTKIYDRWAENYDDYVKKLNYQGPQNLVKELEEFLKVNKLNNVNKLNILDFGCGTGLLGLEINKVLGSKYLVDIDGIDISENMIIKSRDKNVYRQIWHLDLTNEILPQQYQFDIIVSSGVFLEGHVSFSIIDTLLNSLDHLGFIFFTVRDSFKKENLLEYTKYIYDNSRLEILNEINIEYLPDVKCKLVIGQKLF